METKIGRSSLDETICAQEKALHNTPIMKNTEPYQWDKEYCVCACVCL
jgi:hypothetical protein